MDNQRGLIEELNDAPLSLFHLKAVITSGMGFLTDAYDLFIIGAAMVLITPQWHLSKVQTGLLGSTALVAAFVGAFVFGRLADVIGRKKIYGVLAIIMAAGALATAFAPNFTWLLIFRFILGIGIGGDYPVSAVLMSEYSNRKDRGKLVGLVFSMQAVGLVLGPIVAITLLGSGIPNDIAWRLMLGLGAIPAAAVIWLRRQMPESPRYVARVQGKAQEARQSLSRFVGAQITGSAEVKQQRLSFWQFISNPKYLLYLVGTAGTWFVCDYAYYGNSISMPLVLKLVAPSATPITTYAWTLIVFAVAAVPGYALAVSKMDKIGHKKLQLIGFIFMGLAFGIIGIVPNMTSMIVPFLIVFGASYFFAEFGPNTTTFVMSSEVYPTSVRTTGHGISAGVAKIGAFIGVFVFPILTATFGLRGTLFITFLFSIVGVLLTLLLPEPAQRSLETVSGEDPDMQDTARDPKLINA